MEETPKKTSISVPIPVLLRLRATLKWRETYADKISQLLDLYDKVNINSDGSKTNE